MKWFIASDIHGSEYYCKKMLVAYKKENCDKILLLGDILNHGPRNDLPKGYNPKGVIDLLNNISNEILCVKGNCDSAVDSMVLEFPIVSDTCIIHDNGICIFVAHGHNYNETSLPILSGYDILLNGHTHIPMVEIKQNYTYINPGSISIPKGGNKHSYMIFENKNFIIKSLDGDVIKTYNQETKNLVSI